VSGYAYAPAPSAPTSLSAALGSSNSKIALSWTGSSGTAAYNIYRATSVAGPFTLIGNSAGAYYDDTSCSSETMYAYYVTATNTGGESDPSAKAAGFRCDPSYATLEIVNWYSSPLNKLYISISNTTLGWSSAANQLPTGTTIAASGGTFRLFHILVNSSFPNYYVRAYFSDNTYTTSSSMVLTNGYKKTFNQY